MRSARAYLPNPRKTILGVPSATSRLSPRRRRNGSGLGWVRQPGSDPGQTPVARLQHLGGGAWRVGHAKVTEARRMAWRVRPGGRSLILEERVLVTVRGRAAAKDP